MTRISNIRQRIVNKLFGFHEQCHLGVPNETQLEKVRYLIIRELAYEAWEVAERPHYQDVSFWIIGEQQFDEAVSGW